VVAFDQINVVRIKSNINRLFRRFSRKDHVTPFVEFEALNRGIGEDFERGFAGELGAIDPSRNRGAIMDVIVAGPEPPIASMSDLHIGRLG